ncbi:glycosyltransferase [Polaribacter sp. L3A8]|uniref:glycosyltransferase n=1 Tax=Polaribacter sp. L3A8 TaxID=2686361 RepID=UPI00131D3D71|nr:glycosyltransferase family 2 protein [Polaribacter sp. L3A8]
MLAIVIPYFKLTYFEETIKSLVNQNNKNFTVYIGNDASSECPKELLEKYKDTLNFKYKKFSTNLGGNSLVKQWDRCIDLIENEDWIMILGDDDYLENTVVDCFYNSYKEFKGKANVIRFSTKNISDKSNTTPSKNVQPKWELASDAFFRRINGETGSTLSEYIFSKKSYDKFGFFNYPLAWHSDDQAWLDFSDGKPIFSINEASVIIRISNLSITGKKDNLKLKDEANILFYEKFLLENLSSFSKRKRRYILMRYELVLKDTGKIPINKWFILFKNYANNFEILSFFKLIRRFMITIFFKAKK